MRTLYPGYQQPSEADLERLWAECAFTFDASALLDLYRLRPETRDTFLDVMHRLQNRLWLPHQAGLEYHDNRLDVINHGLALHERIAQMVRDAANQFRKGLDSFRQYRWLEAERWAEMLDKAAQEIAEECTKQARPLKDYIDADPIEQRLHELFDGRVGPPYKDLHDLYERAELRIQRSVPPGFKDAAEKKDYRRYGDVVIWFQLLDFAKAQKKPVVFVTGDSKTDWWLVQSGKTVGPRPELIQEMLAFSGVSFYMYSPDRFIEYAQKYLKLEVQRRDVESAADELRQVEAEKAAESQRRAEVFEQAHKIVAAYIPPSNVQLQALLEGLAKAKVANQVPVQRLMESMKVANQDPVQRLMESLKAANQDPAQRLMESLKAAYLDPVQQLMEGLKVAYRDPAQQLMEGLKAYRDMGQQLVEGLKMYRDPVQQLMEGLAKAKVGGSEQPSEILEKPAQPRPVDPPETDGTTNNGEEH